MIPIIWYYAAAACLLLIIIIVILRAVLQPPVQKPLHRTVRRLPDLDAAVQHLSEAVQFATVSHTDPEKTDWNAFEQFYAWMLKTYPRIASTLQRETINGYTRIFKWEGSDKSLQPALFIAHQDVVPAGDLSAWQYEPFSGTVADHFVWGRGAMDIKVQLIEILESVEFLLSQGFQPKRGVYIAFGHDEEINGKEGAAAAAAYFAEKKIHFSFLLDEGGCVTKGMLEGIRRPVATVGVAEKGYIDINLTAESTGGHASMPPRHSSVGILSRALAVLEQRQLPLRLTPTIRKLFSAVSPYMPFRYRLVTANLWLFKPLFLRMVAKSSTGNALLRSTITPTMTQGSHTPNVLPPKAKATVNCRILPGETKETIISYIRRTTAGKFPVSIEMVKGEDPSRTTAVESDEFDVLKKTISQIFPDAVAAPYIMVGGTDARNYEQVCDCIFRFSPYAIDSEELSRMHSFNERISIDNIRKGLAFYLQLIENLQTDFLLLQPR